MPTEATWQKPTAYEEERAKFSDSMREKMNARVRQEYSNPLVSVIPALDNDSTMRAYLAGKGYKSVSDNDLAKIRSLMVKYNVRHINEIGL